MKKRPESNEIDVIILCGGKGERLRSVISDRPKPLADIHGRPFLDLLIDHVASYGFLRFILCTGYMGEQIEKHYSRSTIIISREENPLGTGGAIKNASEHIVSNPFMVMNGDSFCPANLQNFINDYFRKEVKYEMVLSKITNRKDVGLVTIGPEMEVKTFHNKGTPTRLSFINAGIYVFSHDIFDHIPGGVSSLEADVLPKIIGNGLYGYLTKEECFDIGTPQRYHSFLQKRARIR